MTSKIIEKLALLHPWQLLLVVILASEILTMFFSLFFSFTLWGQVTNEVFVIGIIDAFFVALILASLLIVTMKQIQLTKVTNKQLREQIEERKCAEAANRKLEKRLQHAQKMEALGNLAGGVAHDLNNILSGVVGYPELLLHTLPKDSDLRKPLEAIHDSGNRAATVVADMLTVARGAASIREIHNLNVLIEEYLISPECK